MGDITTWYFSKLPTFAFWFGRISRFPFYHVRQLYRDLSVLNNSTPAFKNEMASSSEDSRKEGPPAPADVTPLSILADAASEQVPLPPSMLSAISAAPGLAGLAGAAAVAAQQELNDEPLIPFTNPFTGTKGKALVVSKDDPRLTSEFVARFADVLAVDDDAKPLENSEETVATWTDDLRRKQAYRGRGYATEIVEVGVEEARKEAEKAAEEKEEKKAKEKSEKEELERKKKMKQEVQKGEARKRKQSRKEAAARRRNFQPDIKADYGLDTTVTEAGNEE